MHTLRRHEPSFDRVSQALKGFLKRRLAEASGFAILGAAVALGFAMASWSVADPSLNHATSAPVRNLLGTPGAIAADLMLQVMGLGAVAALLPLTVWSLDLIRRGALPRFPIRLGLWIVGSMLASATASALPSTARWPLPTGLGGVLGDRGLGLARMLVGFGGSTGSAIATLILAALTILALSAACGLGRKGQPPRPKPAEEAGAPGSQRQARPERDLRHDRDEIRDEEPSWAIISLGALAHGVMSAKAALRRNLEARAAKAETLRHALEASRAAARLAEPESERPRAPASPAKAIDMRGRRIEPALDVPAASAVQRVAAPATDPRSLPERVPESAPGPGDETDDDDAVIDVPVPPARSIVDDSYLSGRVPAALDPAEPHDPEEEDAVVPPPVPPSPQPAPRAKAATPARVPAGRLPDAPAGAAETYELPALELLAEPRKQVASVSKDALEQNATLLESTLEDFGVRGEIINVRPGPVVTLYELEPAPGTKSSRVIGLADDIARSMSAVSARVAVVPGRNAIGIELPNQKRETVYLRELLDSADFVETKLKLALCLGKTIGGEPVIADLARMPHLLVAGTTGSGKSVAINTMILSLLYMHKPEQCRLIMVDPKMLELSVYDGIPHLLSPVVTDPKKAVIALKWAVREMEERYKKMSKLSVRNIDGFNARMIEAREKGETITRTVQDGFDRQTGEILYAEEEMDLEPLPYIVIIVDEMADLMMVAGKDIEGAIQRLAQMARAAGIHLIMATQRPSVDVITGTIKANFPTRISFQVTSKIDSRTILGEMGAEQLLGQGDMLHMAGGGRITRVHGPFVSDAEVEQVVDHLKRQGRPQYLEAVTLSEEEGAPEADGAVFDKGAMAASFGEEGGDLYDQAIAVVLRDKKASTSYIQRRLGIGYNRAASIMERMETEGIVGPANHAGKREILLERAEA